MIVTPSMPTTGSAPAAPLLSVRQLTTSLHTPRGVIHPVDGVSFDVWRCETFSLRGDSGWGYSKSAVVLRWLLPPLAAVDIGG